MPDIGGLADIRTPQRGYIRSLPASHRSHDLERHMLAKEKERLDKEIAVLERKCRQRRRRLADIQAKLDATCDREEARSTARLLPVDAERPRNEVATMTVEY